jgi:16S rRNA (cytosine967-C5)-methyltransferase
VVEFALESGVIVNSVPSERGPKPANAREVALAVVRDVFGPEKRGAQSAFNLRASRSTLDARDRAFAAELAYGSIKARRRLDYELAPYIGDRLKTMPPTIVEILRLGAYQLAHMSGVEDHAAVSETVNLAWRHGHRGTAGLVNAVLRKMIADGPRPLERDAFASDDEYLAMRYSLPTWISAQFGRAYGDAREAALAGIGASPQHAVRVNRLRASVAAVRADLESSGAIVTQSPFVFESLLLEKFAPLDDPGGRWSVQSEAAAMPVDLLAPMPGERVLDLCSGRGNKSVQIGARLNGEGTLACVELDEKKTRLLAEALERAGVANVAIVNGDARTAAAEFVADAVLLDAPCSGLGVIGRHPEARWRKDPADGARLSSLQAELIRAAAARTAPGGRLVYAVCSSDPREGRAVVDGFLAEHPAFSRAALPERYAPFDRDGDVVVVPGVEGRDGFYIASLRRA